VAGVVERVGGTGMAATMRRAANPERLAETLAPVTRRFETARQDVERIVASLVGRGSLTWEEGARLKDDVGAVFRESVSDVLQRVKHLLSRVGPIAPAELAREIADVTRRIDQLEALAGKTFPAGKNDRPEPKSKKSAKRATPAARVAAKGRKS
jgi:hypothetical protein